MTRSRWRRSRRPGTGLPELASPLSVLEASQRPVLDRPGRPHAVGPAERRRPAGRDLSQARYHPKPPASRFVQDSWRVQRDGPACPGGPNGWGLIDGQRGQHGARASPGARIRERGIPCTVVVPSLVSRRPRRSSPTSPALAQSTSRCRSTSSRRHLLRGGGMASPAALSTRSATGRSWPATAR